MTKQTKDESTPTEYEISRIHDMGDDDTAVMELTTTQKIGRTMSRNPITSVVLAGLITGIILWSSSQYWELLLHDTEQPHIDGMQNYKLDIITTDVERLAETCDAMELEQQQQRIMLIEIKAAVDGLKNE